MLAPLQRGHRDHGVGVIWRRHHYRVHVFPVEQFAVIVVSPAPAVLTRPLLLGVALIHQPPRWLAPAELLLLALRPRPREITAAFAIDVADRHHLDFRESLEGHHVLQALSSEADASEGRSPARRN